MHCEIVVNMLYRRMVSFGYPAQNFNYHHFDLKSHRPNVLKLVVEPSILKHRPRETSVIESYLDMCESSFINDCRKAKKGRQSNGGDASHTLGASFSAAVLVKNNW